MNTLALNQHEVNAAQYSAGIDMYRRGKPFKKCINRWQRQGWRDAQAGERACAVIDAIVANGGNAASADRALAGEWR